MTIKKKQLNIRLVRNDNISSEEEQKIWSQFFDIVFQKINSKNKSSLKKGCIKN